MLENGYKVHPQSREFELIAGAVTFKDLDRALGHAVLHIKTYGTSQ